MIYYCFLDAKNFRLGVCKEKIINKKFSLKDMAEEISKELNIPIDNLEASKIRDMREFLLEDILE